jgi:hypothetical protein
VCAQVVEYFEAGWQYAEAEAIVGTRGRGDAREYLVTWSDGAEDSWESEDNVARSLVSEFERARRAAARGGGRDGAARDHPGTPQAAAEEERVPVTA